MQCQKTFKDIIMQGIPTLMAIQLVLLLYDADSRAQIRLH